MTSPSVPFASIFFDCDSTLSTIEGVDELAATADSELRAAIESLTHRAMNGELEVEEAYGERLRRLRPGRADIERIAARYVETIVPDAADVIAALQALGKQIGIVSGGLRQALYPLAAHLGIAPRDVHAVGLRFDQDGSYAGFETGSPMTRNHGKPELLKRLKARSDRLAPLAFVGDGMTDLETATESVGDAGGSGDAGGAERFIAFCGVVRREPVVAAATHIATGPSLATILPFCITDTERKQLAQEPRFARLLV